MPTKSQHLFERAKTLIPGGVNSPVRAFQAVGGDPIYFEKGHGAYVYDVDNQRYLDFVASWGPFILGHAYPPVLEAISIQLSKGLGFGAPTQHAVTMAEHITRSLPSVESVRMVNSGTEATMTAIRLARAFTGRNKIVKFQGCYHGHVDALLVKAGSGLMTLGIPGTPGVPTEVTQHTLTANFNDPNSVIELFKQYGREIAAVIVEPIAGNMGMIPGTADFLQTLREVCDSYESLLIFDEVISGFRVGLGGAQGHYGIKPDLTTLGKIIGGGLPVGAFGGRREIMNHLAPVGPVYQAGTLSGNPLALSAGIATLETLIEKNPYETLAAQTTQLVTGLRDLAASYHLPLVINQFGSMFSLFFTNAATVNNYQTVMQADTKQYQRFFHGMLAQGIYFAPSAFETAFLSTAHLEPEITLTLKAAETVFKTLT